MKAWTEAVRAVLEAMDAGNRPAAANCVTRVLTRELLPDWKRTLVVVPGVRVQMTRLPQDVGVPVRVFSGCTVAPRGRSAGT